MTLKDALKETVRMLETINVPAGLVNQIGFPLMSAIGNLHNCIDAIPDPTPEEAEEKAIREEDL